MASRLVSNKDFKHIKVALPDNYELLVASLESGDGKTCKLELSNGRPLVTQNITFGNAKSKAEMIEALFPHLPKVEKHAWEEYFAALDTSVQTEIESLLAASDDEESGDDTGRKSQATKLVDLALEAEVEFFHTPQDEEFSTITIDGRQEHWPLREQGFRGWWARLYYEKTGKAPGAQAMQDALTILQGKARFDGPELHVYTRLAQHDGAIYLDLGNEDWCAVKITADGWDVTQKPPVKFRRPRGMAPLPVPVKGGTLDDLRPFINVTDDNDWRLIVSWLLAALRPCGPYPALVLHGEQGSAKSTTARVLRSLVDPNHAALRPPHVTSAT